MSNIQNWFLEIFNIRFWWFLVLTLLPVWAGIIGCVIEGIRERREHE